MQIDPLTEPDMGTLTALFMRQRRYFSMQGFWMRTNDAGDAEGNYTLLSMQSVKPDTTNYTENLRNGWYYHRVCAGHIPHLMILHPKC